MEDSSPRNRLLWLVSWEAALIGFALAVVAVSGGGVFLRDAAGLAGASIGVVFTAVIALAVGIWAGSEAAAEVDAPLRNRWLGSAAMIALAGVLATGLRTFPALAQGAPVRMVALLVLVAAPVYAVGLLLPTLLARAERQLEAVEEELADVLTWQPLGCLVMGALIGFAVGTSVTGLVLVPSIGAGPALIGVAAALVLPTLVTPPSEQTAEQRVIYETESPLSRIRVVELTFPGQRQPERRLYVNDEEESGEQVRSGMPTLAYIAAAEQWLTRASSPGESYLFLGGGAHSLPRRTAERDPKARITVVELDPEVTRTAYRYFGVRRHHGITTLHGDARAFLQAERLEPVNRIYVDVYAGQEVLPHALVTREAFGEMATLLRRGGSLTLNAIGTTGGPGSLRLWSLVRTVADVFPSVVLFTHLGADFPEPQNVLISAATEPDAVLPDRAGIFQAWRREDWPDVSEAIVFRDLYPDPRRDAARAEAVRPPEPAERSTRG